MSALAFWLLVATLAVITGVVVALLLRRRWESPKLGVDLKPRPQAKETRGAKADFDPLVTGAGGFPEEPAAPETAAAEPEPLEPGTPPADMAEPIADVGDSGGDSGMLSIGRPRGDSHFKKLLDALWALGREGEEAGATGTESQLDTVDCSLYAPPAAKPGARIMVQAWAYLPKDEGLARAMAREFDEEARRRGSAILSTDIARGSTLTFDLKLPGAVVPEPEEDLRWRGRTDSVSFAVHLPDAEGDLIGKLLISQDSVPIGRITFKISVRSDADRGRYAEPAGEAKRFRHAFISYASADRPEVLKRVQMLRLLKYEFFQDVLDLEPGQRWERELYRQIDSADAFFLFWSSAARRSEWVRKEIDYAIDRKAGDEENPPEIIPVIIEGPPPPAPPESLAGLHFNDRIIYFMRKIPVKVGETGWLKCPKCGIKFSTSGETWTGRRHKSCGAELELL